MKRILASALVLSMISLGLPATSFAAGRQDNGTIAGTAKDRQLNAIRNTTARLRNVSTGQIAGNTTTNEMGEYLFTNLNPGNYVVELVDAAGNVIGTSASISLTTGAMAISGVAVTATSAAGAAAAAAAAGGLGGFFTSTAGVILIAGAGAGITAGALASRTASPSK